MDLRTTTGEERSFLASSFEPDGDGYLFYRHLWARGVPVSAEEREAYLRPSLGSSRRAFYEAIRGRKPTVPRRSWLRGQKEILITIPARFGAGLVVVAVMLIWRGEEFEPASLRWALRGAGGLFAAYGLAILAARQWRG